MGRAPRSTPAALSSRRSAKGWLPQVGDGGGVWSFVHTVDAAAAAVAALSHGRGLYNIVDDEPAPVAVWLPELARLLGAPKPRRVPVWVGWLIGGDALVRMMTAAPRLLERQGQGRARLGAAVPELAPGIRRRAG